MAFFQKTDSNPTDIPPREGGSNTTMKKFRTTIILLLCIALALCGCGAGETSRREPVQELTCTQPDALSGIYPAGGSKLYICSSDYEAERTTVQLVDIDSDAVCGEVTLDGVWSIKSQSFSDGRLALYSRDDSTWRFLSSSLADIGGAMTDNVDGFFSYDASAYYYLSDSVLCRQDIASGERSRVPLSPDLRILDITAFDAQSGWMAVQFFLSPYGSECGTAILDAASGQLSMLQSARYQTAFTGDGLCLLEFDADAMGYSALYESGSGFMYAAADVFRGNSADLYAVSGAPYLIGVADGSTCVYSLGDPLGICPLADSGVTGEMYFSCYLPDAALLAGAVYRDGAFHLYAIDPAQLSFAELDGAVGAESPLTVDSSLADNYWLEDSGAPVAENLQQARQYADTLETRYGVRILLSSQCASAAALCDRAITLTDTMSADEELYGINAALDALARTLSLYPDGFFAQFRNTMGEGGVRFLLTERIDSNYGVVGCAYESREWQNIALDVRMADGLDTIICHELWHATENHILSRDYSAFSPDAWAALNPVGFAYCEDPTLSDSMLEWTLYSSSPDNVYFVDGYSCVNEREDRARIMEYFMVHEDEAGMLIESPAIRQKLQFMCDAVRNNFDTTGWNGVRWESLLG